MKHLLFLLFLPFNVLAQTLTVGLYLHHDEYVAHSRPYQVNWAVFKLMAERSGIQLDAEPYVWQRAIKFVENKRLDVLIGAYYSEQRNAFGYYSHPLAVDAVHLYSVNMSPPDVSAIDKKNSIVGATKGSIGLTLAQEAGFAEVYLKGNSKEVYQLLTKRKLDFAIFSESVAAKHCLTQFKDQRHMSCIKPSQPALMRESLHMIYSRSPRVVTLAKQLDEQLILLINSGDIKPIFMAFNFSEKEYQQWLSRVKNWRAAYATPK